MLMYTGVKGSIYTIGKKIGLGGEGTVYLIENVPGCVAKIFHTETKDMDFIERKIRTMINLPIKAVIDGNLYVAWPEDILYEGTKFVGYVMPYVEAPYEIFYVYCDNANRKKIFPQYTWKCSVQYAYNLSWIVWYLHMNGIVVGDMSMKNIRIDEKGHVVLIGCDSFEIVDPKNREHFPCVVGSQEMLAPELQTVGALSNGHFTKESDNFSLAIHIFKLLMKNAHPFYAKVISKREMDISQAIINGECVYVRDVLGKEVPDWVPSFDILPTDIQNAFRKTFNYSALTALKNAKNRTTAEEWNRILLKLAQTGPNPNLKTCPVNPLHIYPAHNKECPWCGSNATFHDSKVGKKIRNMVGF